MEIRSTPTTNSHRAKRLLKVMPIPCNRHVTVMDTITSKCREFLEVSILRNQLYRGTDHVSVQPINTEKTAGSKNISTS